MGSDFDRDNKSVEFTPEIECMVRLNTLKAKKKKKRNPSVALNFSFSSQSQWGIWPFLVVWFLDSDRDDKSFEFTTDIECILRLDTLKAQKRFIFTKHISSAQF